MVRFTIFNTLGRVFDIYLSYNNIFQIFWFERKFE